MDKLTEAIQLSILRDLRRLEPDHIATQLSDHNEYVHICSLPISSAVANAPTGRVTICHLRFHESKIVLYDRQTETKIGSFKLCDPDVSDKILEAIRKRVRSSKIRLIGRTLGKLSGH